RAGMALACPAGGGPLHLASFPAYAVKSLPPYARPLFVRVADALDITGNFKNRKVRLQEESFDPARVSDPLWFRDDERPAYAPLDAALHAEIVGGRRNL